MFRRVLVANRGEIAVRVIRALHELGIEAVAVYSEADRAALHVRLADYAYPIGPAPAPQSYLDAASILAAARRGGAEAIHPGYGFLSESAAFARACEEAGMAFIGPTPEALALMGDKVAARRLAAGAGVPTVPGTPDPLGEDESALRVAAEIGFPLLIKAAAGGGGKGMRAVHSPDDLLPALGQARREAVAAFGEGSVYLERLVQRPRHIEVQLFGDGAGRVVHLGERECSLQRRFQKVVEEAPAPHLPADVRGHLVDAAAAAGAARYRGAGTIEFLYEPDAGRFYFLEMNARLQVEHPVTEIVAGVDLVQAQLRLAAGESLDEALWGAAPPPDPASPPTRHAIEARITAEDPLAGWLPSTGVLGRVREPGGLGVRVDSACEPGLEVGVHYDSLLAKLICWGRTREEAVARLRRALDEYLLQGLRTSLPFHRWLVRDPAFLAAELSTGFIAERWGAAEEAGSLPEGEGEGTREVAQAAALAAADAVAMQARSGRAQRNGAPADGGSRWRAAGRQEAVR